MESFTKPTLKHILDENGESYLKDFGSEIRLIEQETLQKTLQCRTEKNGYQSYFCWECGAVHKIRFSCKSRLCSKCGDKANEIFAELFVRRMLPVTHRFITFTVPDRLWEIFHSNPLLQQGLSIAAKNTLEKVMKMYLGKDVTPGCMNVLHNYGRDLKKNCHTHVIATEGGIDLNGKWVHFTYLPFEKRGRIHTTINEIWRDEVLEMLRLHLPRTQINHRFLIGLKKQYSNGFYVNSPKECRIKTNRSLRNKAKYITRYVKHPVISDTRITDYDGQDVKFWYQHPTTKEKRTIIMPVFKFIHAVLRHLPEKHFRAVTYYGLYSPNYPQKEQIQTVFSIEGKTVDPLKLNWREMVYLKTGRNPICCPICGRKMVLVATVYWKNGDPITCYYLSIYDRMAIKYPDDEMWLSIKINSFAR
jgi:hypothetical protein